jgi:hypothetical protein
LIPDYDRISSIKKSDDVRTVRYQKDNNVRSGILNDLLVSFQWHAIINDKLISVFNLWAISEDYQTPDLIFLGNYQVLLQVWQRTIETNNLREVPKKLPFVNMSKLRCSQECVVVRKIENNRK